jgi:RHS repeat-associated protein
LPSLTRSIAGTGDDLFSLDSYDSAENLTTMSGQFGSAENSDTMPAPFDVMGPVLNEHEVRDDDVAYNIAGQVTGSTIQLGQSSESNSYSYDADNQLTGSSGESDDSYSYDANGNPNSTGYTTGTGNELTHSPGVTYTYDNVGNMITATTSSGTTTYTYDNENRLTNVEINGTMAATYTYDALGRRIGIDDSGTQTWTVFNGTSADANPYADFTSSGALKMRYLDGLAVDEILAQTDASGDTSWYLTDQLGSVVAIASTSAVLDQIVYDPFGNIVTQTNATDAVRFGFAGMEFDSVTGLYYDHARYYDAAIGRFISKDPKGFAAGDTDLYRYVGNQPSSRSDPTGEDWLGLGGGLVGGAVGVGIGIIIVGTAPALPVIGGIVVVAGLLGATQTGFGPGFNVGVAVGTVGTVGLGGGPRGPGAPRGPRPTFRVPRDLDNPYAPPGAY